MSKLSINGIEEHIFTQEIPHDEITTEKVAEIADA